MPAGKHKSRSLKRIFVRTPGSKTVVHYRKRQPGKAICGECHKVLPGTARGNPSDLGKLSKTQKRPERPFGGVLCTSCSRKKIIQEARK